jgi:uncharacterized protein (UPF0548 family)
MYATQLAPDVEAHLRADDLTYDQVGRTSGVLPDGYHHLNTRMIVGLGTDGFAKAARALFGWQMHLRAGLRVSTSSATVEHDAVVMLGIGAGSFRLNAPCRVVYIIDEPNRQGFAYGTLPGHPESGEEAFVVERANDDTVRFSITAFSRPASDLAKLAGPLGRIAQRRMTARYLRTLAEATEHDE